MGHWGRPFPHWHPGLPACTALPCITWTAAPAHGWGVTAKVPLNLEGPASTNWKIQRTLAGKTGSMTPASHRGPSPGTLHTGSEDRLPTWLQNIAWWGPEYQRRLQLGNALWTCGVAAEHSLRPYTTFVRPRALQGGRGSPPRSTWAAGAVAYVPPSPHSPASS